MPIDLLISLLTRTSQAALTPQSIFTPAFDSPFTLCYCFSDHCYLLCARPEPGGEKTKMRTVSALMNLEILSLSRALTV
ncbi:hypothetical protein KFK09_018668 [Dendrobium nobile]|uniref:Uncharacterized protein n=1 Tax=Dendrobium nobile TaxID=94219 RepID=A0A8T3AV05_DENNO|nr:hypothetical protein KFK09_018668 [Dendrobium nobile]